MSHDSSSDDLVAIVFAKEEAHSFHRCSIPILGRPVLHYPLLAAINAPSVGRTFLSTSSTQLSSLAEVYTDVEILSREQDADSLLEEFYHAANAVIQCLGNTPEWMLLMLGNSPCVVSESIESAISILREDASLDSVVSAERRGEFSPRYAHFLDDEGLLREGFSAAQKEACYFPNFRLLLVRTDNLLRLRRPFAHYGDAFGTRAHPVLQEEGVGDIDYSWQVPLCEHWLRNHGFSDSSTPYANSRSEKTVVSDRSRSSVAGNYRVLVTTVPFGAIDHTPIEQMRKEKSCELVINPIGRKLKEDELAEMIADYDIVIAGTEPITQKVLTRAKRLKLISRVGIGLDSVDLYAARERGICVSYTPDAPAPAVAEMTIGHMVNLCRQLSVTDRRMREGVWQRHQGVRLANMTIGIIGVGRVGSRVLKHLQGFSPARILVNDLKPNHAMYELYGAQHVEKEVIFSEADIITLHVPLTPVTSSLIGQEELALMKSSVMLINTSRGGVIDEKILAEALSSGTIAGAAVDVFNEEPYVGELVTLDNCVLSSHMGSCTVDCRADMERLATEEAIRFIRGEPLRNEVPEYEYELSTMRGRQ